MIRISIQSDIPTIPSLQPRLLEPSQQMCPWNVIRSHNALCRIGVKKERVCRCVEIEKEVAARSTSHQHSEPQRNQQSTAADGECDITAVVKHHNVRDHSKLDGAGRAVLDNNERE